MAKRYTAEQWGEWFGEFEQSGLTVHQFCELKGSTANTFYKWRRKLQADQLQPAFVPLVTPDPQVEFELPCGAIVRVPNETRSLRPIVSVLLDETKR